ncbi:hypothetical protein O6H91_20G076100 [Diphasiastrum complanatum]|uniref:Uncharacterized protein n=1 Tax=Diphasiastrum complanatum TaxID=34168 RepID=A0ACC2AS43_DIPCM|nr:hypothetical protein O6H91_20G076100 [Diphasiastrum complanatum]
MEESKKRKVLHEEGIGSWVAPNSKDDLKRLLEPLSKEQLVELLADAGCQYPAVADEISDVASKDPAHRKLFVRGLAWETTSQALRDAFEQYGEIEEGAVVTDKATGKSRGFGFITFKHMDSAQRALKEPSKTIDGRITICNLASVGSYAGSTPADQSQRKLYVGGLSYDTSNETLLHIFAQYGEIEEGSVAYDKNTNRSRGFAFITYKTVEAAKKAVDDPSKTIEGRHVTVKLAAEGQKEKAAAQYVTPPQQGQVIPVQAGYGVVNPNIPNYARAPGPAPAAPQLGFSHYAPGLSAYSTQPAYPGVAGNPQYGAVGAPLTQYNPAQYAQYASAFPQSGQAVFQTAPAGGAGVVPTYYRSAK